jgi:hypothetical protein
MRSIGPAVGDEINWPRSGLDRDNSTNYYLDEISKLYETNLIDIIIARVYYLEFPRFSISKFPSHLDCTILMGSHLTQVQRVGQQEPEPEEIF